MWRSQKVKYVRYEIIFYGTSREVRAMKESRSSHDKITGEFESALARNSAIPKGKNLEAEEALHSLNTARTNFRYSALKMVYSISVLQQRKRFDILDNVSLSTCLAFLEVCKGSFVVITGCFPLLRTWNSCFQ